MSYPASPPGTTARRAAHSRHTSATSLPQDATQPASNPQSPGPHAAIPVIQSSKPQSPRPATATLAIPPAAPKQNVHYTVFIRLPFIRGSFEDPPPVEWDVAKDKALWKLISKASNATDLNWDEIASRFEVSLPFVLQQAAWLYERHLKGLRGTVEKLGSVAGAASSPSPVTETPFGLPRPGSRDERVQGPSTFPRRDSPQLATDTGSALGTPKIEKPPISRIPSTATVTQSKVLAGSQRQGMQRRFRGSSSSQRRPGGVGYGGNAVMDAATGSDAESSGTEESADLSRSQESRRPVYGRKPPTARTLSSDADVENDDDGDSSGESFLPFAAASRTAGSQDPAATLKGAPAKAQWSAKGPTQAQDKGKSKASSVPIDSSESSASSAPQPTSSRDETQVQRPGPLSPRHRAQLEQLSPRYKKTGSDGTPSMGSSFSDLDDTSITQSALEEAVLSKVGNASIASRMSSLGSAWKGKK